MATQEEKRFKQWAAALAVYDSVHKFKQNGYRELYAPAEIHRNVLTAEDKMVGQAVMEKPDYNKAMIVAHAVVDHYFIKAGVY